MPIWTMSTFQELFMLVGPTTSLGPEKKCNQPNIVCGMEFIFLLLFWCDDVAEAMAGPRTDWSSCSVLEVM
ncbi:hypothetical protein ZEAMMB73_Zm00001d048929 [Zea mays]|uniref:Uncharacterized protein n=1 Tax=Zea mays TaxID=4577 RepID=A0A1D6PR65_MAIZE|nr:hypothetical protein ZEAMMB73_Zm00001d048929 [Zea mays]